MDINVFMFRAYRQLDPKDFDFDLHDEIVLTDPLPSPEYLLLQQIFAIDPRTGAPRGDIAQYLTSETNPEIRQYIENNLMYKQNTSTVPFDSRITDKDIFDSMPYPNEHRDQYLQRVRSMLTERKNLEFLQEYSKKLKDEYS